MGSPMGPQYGKTPVLEASSTHKPLAYESSQVSQQGPHGKRCPSPEPSCTPPGFPNSAPVKRDAPFLVPSFHYLSQFPVNGPPSPGSPTGLLRRETLLYRTFYIPSPENSSCPQSPQVREPPPCSPTGSLWRKIFRHQSHCSIYSYMSARVPKKRSPPTKWGETCGHRPQTPTETDRWPTYSGVRPGSPRGLLTTLLTLPSAMQPSARYLPAWCG